MKIKNAIKKASLWTLSSLFGFYVLATPAIALSAESKTKNLKPTKVSSAELDDRVQVLAKQFESDEGVTSKVYIKGPSKPDIGKKQNYEFIIEGVKSYESRTLPYDVSLEGGLISLTTPHALKSQNVGVYVHYNDIKIEYLDNAQWKQLIEKESKGGKLLFGLFKMGIGALPGPSPFTIINIGKMFASKDSEKQNKEEELENYYDITQQLWEKEYPGIKVSVPLTIKGELSDKEKISLQVVYMETVKTANLNSQSQDITTNTQSESYKREVKIGDVLGLLKGK